MAMSLVAENVESLKTCSVGCEGDSNVVAFCFQCSHALCSKCVSRHSQRPANRTHVSIPMTNIKLMSLVCSLHTELAIDYCITCLTITCIRCHGSTHQGHTFRNFCLTNRRHTHAITNMESLCLSERKYQQNLLDQKTKVLKVIRATNENIDQRVLELLRDIMDKKFNQRLAAHVINQGKELKRKMARTIYATIDELISFESYKRYLESRIHILEMLCAPIAHISGLSLDDPDGDLSDIPSHQKQMPGYLQLKFVSSTNSRKVGELQVMDMAIDDVRLNNNPSTSREGLSDPRTSVSADTQPSLNKTISLSSRGLPSNGGIMKWSCYHGFTRS